MSINNCKVTTFFTTVFFGLFWANYSNSQSLNRDFKQVDAYARSIGSLDSMNMGTIANILTQKFTDKEDKVRAIYVWITNYINQETKPNKADDPKYNTSDAVLKNRKAGSLGYATLFQDMCSAANIRCLTVEGFAKFNTDNINEKNAEINHTWAVVQLGLSPDEWYYVDPYCGSGYLDKKGSNFTTAFEDAYFFAEKDIFNWQHYPNNEKWLLGQGPKSKKSFYELPLIKAGAYHFQISRFSPNAGLIKTKTDKPVAFTYTLSSSTPIDKVTLLVEENKKKTQKNISGYITNGERLSFNHLFDREGTYDVTILINDLELMQYLVEVE